MKNLAQVLVLFALPALWLLAGCSHVSPASAPAQSLQVGAAEVDITPPIGYRMAGYFKERLSTGIHDPLHANAIVLRQGSEQIALVACDLIGVPLEVSTNARVRISQRTGIPVSNSM